jgi:hypothetical protein
MRKNKQDNSAAALAARHRDTLDAHEQTVANSQANYDAVRQNVIDTAVEQVRAVDSLMADLDAQKMGLTTLIREELGADVNKVSA